MSATLEDLSWDHTTVLTGEAEKAVADLRDQVDGEIVVYGSGQLASTLLAHDLVDELRLTLYPRSPVATSGCSATARRPGDSSRPASSAGASSFSPTARPIARIKLHVPPAYDLPLETYDRRNTTAPPAAQGAEWGGRLEGHGL